MLSPLLDYFQSKVDDTALSYLENRGITPDDVKKFNIGFVPSSGLPALNWEEYNQWKKKLWLRDALVFPFYNILGQPVALEFRTIKDKFHIKFIPKKSKEMEGFFFGLNQALPSIWKTKTVYITEGGTDCISIAKVIPNIIASSTAAITVNQFKLITRFADKVIFIYDNDRTGVENRNKLIEKFRRYSDVSTSYFVYPTKDANKYLEEYGLNKFIRKTKELKNNVLI